jgi:hypothetical protein
MDSKNLSLETLLIETHLEFGNTGAEAFGGTSRHCVGSIVVRQGTE